MKILKFLFAFVAVLSISFSIPATVLAAPGAVYPTYGQLIYTYSSGFEFQWSSAGSMLTTSYDIEISTDPTFTNTAPGVMVDSNDINHTTSNCGSTIQPNNFPSSYSYLPATTYYWRIQSYSNALCNGDFVTGGSGWVVYYFRTAISAPTLVKPTSGTLVDNLHNDQITGSGHPYPLFQWQPVAGATGYILEVSTVATFTSLYINTSVSPSATFNGGTNIGYSPTSDIASATTFYWRVETLNNTYGPSDWSSSPAACLSGYCTFTSANVSAPPVPLSIAQTNVYKTPTGKVTTDFTPGLRWQAVALPSGATFFTYQVQASNDSTFADITQECFDVDNSDMAILANQVYNNDYTDYNYAQLDTEPALAAGPVGTNCKSSGGKFLPANKFYWRVRAVFGGPAYSDWSTVFSFSTSYPKITTLHPAVTDATHDTITFSWDDISPLPYYYWVQACFSPDFEEGNCVLSQTHVKNPFLWRIPAKDNITSGTILYWRVSSGGTWGPSLWTDSSYANSTVAAP